MEKPPQLKLRGLFIDRLPFIDDTSKTHCLPTKRSCLTTFYFLNVGITASLESQIFPNYTYKWKLPQENLEGVFYLNQKVC